MENNKENIIPVFIPTLAAMLKYAEDNKGSALTKEEVLEIRDKSVCIMLPLSAALALEKSRGRDIDPENCWEEWLVMRNEF